MLLLERHPSETIQDVVGFLDDLVIRIYGRRPEWLEFELRETHKFRDRDFLELYCPAGSVGIQIIQRASANEGIDRDILLLGKRNGQDFAWLLHQAEESEYDPGEVQRIG